MNWKAIFTILTIFLHLVAMSQSTRSTPDPLHAHTNWMGITSQEPSEAQVRLLYSDVETSRIEITLYGFWSETVRTNEGASEIKASAGNSTPLLMAGAPDLEKLTASLAILDLARMEIKVIEEEYVDLEGIYIIPSKGNLTRDIDPGKVPYTYGRVYETDAFWPGVVAELRRPHIIRDIRGQVVIIYPFRYNAVQKILRVYTKLVLEVEAVDNKGENQLTGRLEDEKMDRNFKEIYSRNFLNYQEYRGATRYTPLEEDGNMLIISYGPFMTDMQEFVDWKNMSGIPTEMVDVSAVGATSAAIKTYVANYYNTNGLTFLLLVGDAAQVPTSSTSAGHSDNDYGYIVGSDHYPDLFVGRFSAETSAQVQTQVQRTIDYERNPSTVLGSFERAVCIASDQGPGDDGEYDWQHQRNIRTDYMAFTYTYGAELYDGSQGGEDATGNPTSSMVSSEVNAGTGIITYTGHGSNTSWGTTGFSSTGVNALTNNGMLPFILSVACVNGNFTSTTCFAEAWLRATNSGEPSGAVATIMSTINQSWNPPMRGQDEMVDILVETYPSNIKRTFGGICMNGCMNMNDVYGSQGDEMTDTWTIFGDPSLMVRTASPATMVVSHPADLPMGAGQITVTCDQEGARVAVSNDYQLLGTGVITGGTVDVTFNPVNSEDTLTVTVTAFNCMPSIDSVVVTNADMAYNSSTAFHGNLAGIAPGETDAEVLGVKVVMSGSLNPFDLQSITFNLNGTTDLSDLTGLSVYYTGNSGSFNTASLFGSAAPATGAITVTGTQALAGGNNYFWLAADIDPSAPVGNFIDAGCTGIVLTDSSSVTRVPTVTAPAGAREIETMEMTGITATQPNTQSVAPGEQGVDIIRLEIATTGSPLPFQVGSLKVTPEGTTDTGDIDSVRIYYTTDTVFNDDILFGSAAPADTMMISGSKVLAEGNNYFWIAFDLATGASLGNELDAECLEVQFSGSPGTQVPVVTDPAGYRMVELDYCIPSYTYGTGYDDYISLVELASLHKATGALPSPYYAFYQDVTTHLVIDSTYQLIVSPGTYSSGNNIAAWIDFNRNGTFELHEKLGEVSVPPTPAVDSISFHVPDSAYMGAVRLRVREVWSTTNFDPCSNYNYGETEDYEVHIMPPACWLGITNEWNNPANWSDGVVPGPGCHVTIPEILMGDHYPADFTGANPVVDQLDMEDGATLSIPPGTTFTVGSGNR